MTELSKVYAVVTFGSPAPFARQRWTRDEATARKLADACKGTGTCTCARVLECDTLALARSADISQTRPGERTVYEA